MSEDLLPPEKDRFIIELEFVQCLANPEYLHCESGSLGKEETAARCMLRRECLSDCFLAGLAQNKYLENAAFLEFLRYLKYWKRKEYSRYIL